MPTKMKIEGNADEFTDAVNGKLAKVKTTIYISCNVCTNEVKLVFFYRTTVEKVPKVYPITNIYIETVNINIL